MAETTEPECPECTCGAFDRPHHEDCPVTAYVRAMFRASGENAQGYAHGGFIDRDTERGESFKTLYGTDYHIMRDSLRQVRRERNKRKAQRRALTGRK